VIMDNKCRKFEANIFNKAKCQHCFKSKEEHSAEALENSRVCTAVFFTRLSNICTYIPITFIAPVFTMRQHVM